MEVKTTPENTGLGREGVPQRDAQGRWLPGVSGSPGGREPGQGLSLVGLLKRRLAERPQDAEAIINALISMGRERELGAIREILDRVDGKAIETHRIEGELPIRLVFEPANSLAPGAGAIGARPGLPALLPPDGAEGDGE